MRVLSIDPGHTSGVACYSGTVLEWSMTVDLKTWYTMGFVNRLEMLARQDVVLLEAVPTKYADPKTSTLFTMLHHHFTAAATELVVIQPGAWKGLVERATIPGQHARDAATMAMWYILKGGKT